MNTSLKVDGHDLTITGTVLREVRPAEEWYEDIDDPERLVATLSESRPRADLLTFWQRIPDVVPKYGYHTEWEEVAALPVTTYENWWSQQIKSRTRGLIRKSEKLGLVVKEVEYTDAFVQGMTAIFNETPLRQGRPFWHYGKDFETVKRQFSRYLSRETLIGAYYGDELIGFMMLGSAGRYAVTGQIISMVRHRDKGTSNCLIAKAVEICARERIPYLVYLHWGVGSLAEFKRRMGFEKIRLPRYYVPLTAKGRLALRLGVHRGIIPMIPQASLLQLKRVRAAWYRNWYAVLHRGALVAGGDGE